jgi:hypothetical protein
VLLEPAATVLGEFTVEIVVEAVDALRAVDLAPFAARGTSSSF